MKKFGFFFLLFLIAAGFVAKYALFDYVVSDGKRVGNLTKITQKGKIIKTWEGTLDTGYGEQLTFHFSVKDKAVAQQLYDLENREVVLYYNEHLYGWPRDTKYDVFDWKTQEESVGNKKTNTQNQTRAIEQAEKTLFCSFLGTLISDPTLYTQVKQYIEKNNKYIFNKYEICNEK